MNPPLTTQRLEAHAKLIRALLEEEAIGEPTVLYREHVEALSELCTFIENFSVESREILGFPAIDQSAWKARC